MVRDKIKRLIRYKIYFGLCFVFLHISVGCISHTNDQYFCSRNALIEPAELDLLLSKGNAPVILEIGKKEGFRKGHIPGAKNIWRPDYADNDNYTYGGMRADQTQMSKLLGSLGIKPQDKIILYDHKGDVDAARFRWLLALYGHQEVSLLNGGKVAWELEGRLLSQETKPSETTTYTFHPTTLHKPIDKEGVRAAINDTAFVIIDTRTRAEYSGKMLKNGAKKAGRIPGSIHLDWIEMVNDQEDYRFKSCEEIYTILKDRGISRTQKIITYCHSGVRSAHLAFVLTELLGFESVQNYDGSWTEWSHYEHLPFEVEQTLSLVNHK